MEAETSLNIDAAKQPNGCHTISQALGDEGDLLLAGVDDGRVDIVQLEPLPLTDDEDYPEHPSYPLLQSQQTIEVPYLEDMVRFEEAEKYQKKPENEGKDQTEGGGPVGGRARGCEQCKVEGVSSQHHDEQISALLRASKLGDVQKVKDLLEADCCVRHTDEEGRNCLYLALDYGQDEVAVAILQCENQWQAAMENVVMNKEELRDTPMRKAICRAPEVAEVMLDKCVSVSRGAGDELRLEYDYTFLDDQDHLSVTRQRRQHNHPLNIMQRNYCIDLLSHSVVTALLLFKWKQGLKVFVPNLILYCVFLTLLTYYVVHTAPPPTTPANHSLSSALTTTPAQKVSEPLCAPASGDGGDLSRVGYAIIAIVALRCIIELTQVMQGRWAYFSLVNIMEWIMYVFTILLLTDIDQCASENGLRTGWQWQLGAVAVFLAWFDLILFLGKVPWFGIYITMFTQVLRTFIFFLPILSLFVAAFTFAFFMLLRSRVEFNSIGLAYLKTFVMMTGEFDMASLFLDDAYEDSPLLSPTTYIIFVLFIFIMTILIMNLMVGLAVGDIGEIQESAFITQRSQQIGLFLDLETALLEWDSFCCKPFRRWCGGYRDFDKKQETVYPDRMAIKILHYILRLSSIDKSASTIAEMKKKKKADDLNEKMDQLMEVVRELQAQLADYRRWSPPPRHYRVNADNIY